MSNRIDHLLDYADATIGRVSEATEAFADPRTGRWYWAAPDEPRVFSDGAVLAGDPSRIVHPN